MHKSQEGQEHWRLLVPSLLKLLNYKNRAKTWSQVEKQHDNAKGRSESWIYQAKNCAEGKVAGIFPLVRGIIVQNTGKGTVQKQ